MMREGDDAIDRLQRAVEALDLVHELVLEARMAAAPGRHLAAQPALDVGADDATIEALVYELRTSGIAAIAARRAWIAELSDAQRRGVIVRLARMRPRYPAINDELLDSLVESLRE